MRKRKNRLIAFLLNVVLILFLLFSFVLLMSSYLSTKDQSFLGFRSFIVLTSSMRPTYDAGSYIIVKQKDADLIEAGDVLTYYVADHTVLTHRVVDVIEKNSEYFYITKGDANETNDGEPVAADKVIGTVFWGINGLGALLIQMQKPPVFIAFVVIMALIIVLPEVVRAFSKDDGKE